MEFVAGVHSSEAFTAMGDDPVGRFFVHYQLAFLAYARGRACRSTTTLRQMQQLDLSRRGADIGRAAFATRLAEDARAADATTTG